MPYNLECPTGLREPLDLNNTATWFGRELQQVSSNAHRYVLQHVFDNLDEFVSWPTHALLLWDGCNRIPATGQKQKYHRYPPTIRDVAKKRNVVLDSRPNGPAIAAFHLAGGIRPERFGSSNAWSIHHLYSGKFPYLNCNTTTHAIKKPLHFTQSAGLVASHPVADALCDEFPFFSWFLRGLSFKRFGYDPDGVFSPLLHKPKAGLQKAIGVMCWRRNNLPLVGTTRSAPTRLPASHSPLPPPASADRARCRILKPDVRTKLCSAGRRTFR